MKSIFNCIWNTKWALTIATGLLLGMSYPPIPLPFLIFPAFLFIFRIIDLSDSTRAAAYWTYPAFLIWNVITTYWLAMATLAGGIAAILANAAVMTVPVMLQYKVQQYKIKGWLIALFQTAFWISYEYLHHQWDLAWPWLTLANAWANVPDIVQYISVTGYLGISFWILFATALAYQGIRSNHSISRWGSLAVLILFPLWSAVGSLQYHSTASQTQEVVVVQPNFDSYHPNGGFANSFKAHEHLLQLTDSVRTPATEAVVWPENAIQTRISNWNSFSKASNNTKKMLRQKADSWDATLISGATYFQYYDESNAPPLPYSPGQNPYLPFNAALAFYPDQTTDVYRKHNLVPIVERIPFVHFLNGIDVFNWAAWNQIQGYGKGEKATPFSVGNTTTPALICYDSVFPSWVRKYVVEGAGYLTIITNDGWWGNTSGHEQHFAYARLRAIELDRWVVRSANNGISGIIAPDGSIKVETPYWESTAFRYDVPVLKSQTFYARFGDWLPAVMLLLSAIGIIMTIFRKPLDEDQLQ